MTEAADPAIGVGIIGCGRVVGHHVAAIEASSDLHLVALCDLDLERATAMAPRSEVAIYRDFHEMLAKHPEIDVVAIATPSGLHFPHAEEVVRKFGKSVVLEKPPTLKFTELDRLVELAAERNAHVFPVFQYRFNAPVQRIRRGVEDGELGQPRIVSIRQRWCRTQRYYDQSAWRGTYSLDGGALTNQGIHHLDLVQYLAGPVSRVFARKATIGVDIEAEDSIVATLEFESGAIGTLEITTATRPDDIESSISIVGEHGYAVLGGWATDQLTAYSPQPEDCAEFSMSNEHAYGMGHHIVYSGIVASLRDNDAAPVSVADAVNSLKLLHALYVSASEGRRVALSEGKEFVKLGKFDEQLWALYRA